jgi:hypothetical protein
MLNLLLVAGGFLNVIVVFAAKVFLVVAAPNLSSKGFFIFNKL